MRRLRRNAAWVRAVLAALSLFMAGGRPAEAYLKLGARLGGQQVGLRWTRLPIRYFVNEQGLPGIGAAEYRSALDRAFATWQAINSSTVAFQAAGTTAARPDDADGVTTLGFLARPELDRVLGSTSFIVDTVTGEIVEAGIFFNSAFPWSVAAGGESGKYDVESIALHEIGHLAGLGHSALGETELRAGGRRVLAAEAVMFPIAYTAGSTAGRQLRADDIAGMSDIYPEPAFRTDTGSISGRVTRNGQGVFGAHIVAFNPATGALVGNFALDDQGDFSIAGLAPGSYIVRVEPLDDADLTAFFGEDARVQLNFGVTYLDRLAVVPRGGNAGPYEIKVTPR
jgi:hypothetical protein